MKFQLGHLRLKTIDSISKIDCSSITCSLEIEPCLLFTLNISAKTSSNQTCGGCFGILMTRRFQNCPWLMVNQFDQDLKEKMGETKCPFSYDFYCTYSAFFFHYSESQSFINTFTNLSCDMTAPPYLPTTYSCKSLKDQSVCIGSRSVRRQSRSNIVLLDH